MAEVREQLEASEQDLRGVRRRRAELEDRSEEVARRRQQLAEVYRLMGRVSQYLAGLKAMDSASDLMRSIVELEARSAQLRKSLDPQTAAKRLEAALAFVTRITGQYAQTLGLERAAEPAVLSIPDLTVKIGSVASRRDFLWEVGSGENWVGYHLAVLLALHEYFLSMKHSPVPSFMMVDQPSQVYFPEDWPEDKKQIVDRGSNDIQALRRIFSVLSDAIARAGGDFQLIITDHAGAIAWEGMHKVHVVGNWRDGHDEFLVPKSWL